MKKLVFLLHRVHLYPFRTQKLSCAKPKILARRRAGKIGQCQHFSFKLNVIKNQNNQNQLTESGVENLVFHKKHPTQCMILIILLIYFLITISYIYSELAQLAEHLTVNQVVAGSSPAFGAKKNPRPIGLRVLFYLAPGCWAVPIYTCLLVRCFQK